MHILTKQVHVVELDELIRFASQVAGREVAPFVLDPRRIALFELARLPPLPRLHEASGHLSPVQHAKWEALRAPDPPIVSVSIETILDALVREGRAPGGTYLVVGASG